MSIHAPWPAGATYEIVGPARDASDHGPHASVVSFEAEDGFRLRGTLYSNARSTGPVVLVSSAAAVRRAYYRGFAEALVEAGASAVLTYDFRGIGDSAAPAGWKQRLNMKDWGALDMDAAAQLLERLFPDRPLVGIGQSIGGTMAGLCPRRHLFRRFAMIASGNGYLGLTDEAAKLFLSMNFLALPVAAVLGRVPAWLGVGEPLPASIFGDWARWCRRREFLFDDPAVPEARGCARFSAPILSVGLTDDPWSTPRAIEALLRRFPNAPRTELRLSPAEAGCDRIGHLGFFKPKFAATLWPRVISWLLTGSANIPANS